MSRFTRQQQRNIQHRYNQGFTLIELMVVIVIISIMAATVTLSIGGSSMRTLKSEAQRLQQVMAFAMDEATFKNTQLGLISSDNSYQVLTFNPEKNRWQVSEEPAFDLYTLPDALELQLEIEGKALTLAPTIPAIENTTEQSDTDDEDITPQLLFLSSGEITPFSLQLRLNSTEQNKNINAELNSDGLSTIEIAFHNDS